MHHHPPRCFLIANFCLTSLRDEVHVVFVRVLASLLLRVYTKRAVLVLCPLSVCAHQEDLRLRPIRSVFLFVYTASDEHCRNIRSLLDLHHSFSCMMVKYIYSGVVLGW